MNTDFRVSVDYFEHHKTKKLVKRLGAEGSLCHLKLLAYAAKNRPDGFFTGMDGEDIEIVAGWTGAEGALTSTLCDLNLLEQCEEGIYSIHDWQDHNDWASEADARSDSARLSRLARVNRNAAEGLKADGRVGITKDEYKTYAEGTPYVRRTTNRSTPAPSPAPSPDRKEEDSLSSSVVLPPAQTPAAPVAEDGEREIFPELDSMPIEFQDMVSGYPGRKDVVPAYKAFMARRKDPQFHIQRVLNDIVQRSNSEDWTKDNGRWIPKLSKYLSEEQWRNPTESARASPYTDSTAAIIANAKRLSDLQEEKERRQGIRQ